MAAYLYPSVTFASMSVRELPYFFPLRLLPSVPLSTPLASSPLVAVPEAFAFLDFLRWCSGIHSS